MDESSDIVGIPPTDKWLGSCPECGKPVWESYRIRKTEHLRTDVFKCIECKQEVHGDELIPF